MTKASTYSAPGVVRPSSPVDAPISPRLLVITGYDGSFDEIARLTVPRMEQYALFYACELRVVTDVDCRRPGGWLKVPVIREALDEDFDFVFWIDADALILRYDLNILSTVIPRADIHMAWLGPDTTRWRPPAGLVGHFNTGVMLIRVNDWSRQFFDQTWKVGDLGSRWWEQAAILHLLGYDNLIGMGPEDPAAPYRSHIGRLDPVWNSVPGIATVPDPIVHHYAGFEKSVRLCRLRGDIATINMRERFI